MAIKIRHDGQWVEVGVGSSVADGDYGDIVVSNSGATWTLDSSISGDKISEGDSKAEIIDTATESKLTVEIDATEKFSVDIGGAKIHRQDSSNEGGSVVFNRANDDNAAFEIDVYGGSNTDSGRLRILDQSGSSGAERLTIGPNGEIGLSGANYGSSGQVLTSNGSGSAPTWQSASGGGGGGSSTFIGLTDTPASLGNAGQIVAVNSGGTALEFIDQPSGGGNTGVGTTAQEEPVGTIIAWGGPLSSIPDNYQLCDGGTPQTSTLQDLLGVGANVPDLRDRFIIGAGNNYAVDATGGESTVTLTENQIPSHHHDVDTHNEWSSTHGNWTSGTGYRQEHTWASYYKPETSDTGGGQAHNNMPPYYALCYIIKHTSSSSGSSSFTSGDGFVLLGRKSATGTSVEFTGIPANALEMTLMFEGVSGSTATDFDVQLGTSSGYITTNYDSSSEAAQGTNSSNSTSSFVIRNDGAGYSFHGSMIINKSSSDSYSQIGQFKRSNSAACETFGSLYSISGVVDRLKVSISNSSFDTGGLIGLSYKTSGFGGGGSNSGIGTVIAIEDDGSPVGTASTINFGDNLEVGLSGGVATITGVGTFSGDYNDLENTPTIPTNTSDLNNDSGFIGAGQTFSGDYNDLTNVPQMFGIPSGGIIMWSGAENLIGSTSTGGTGTGWVLCDGQTYTVDGVSVTPPDLRNRFVVGAGSGGNYNVGDTGGSDNVTLSDDEMPSHDHGSSSVSVSVNSSGLTVSSESDHTHGTGTLGMDMQGSHSHVQTFYGGGTSGTVPSLRFDGGGTVNFNTSGVGHHVHTISGSTGSGGGHSHSISGSISGSGTLSMSGEGGGQAHENRPPYYALCYIMKT